MLEDGQLNPFVVIVDFSQKELDEIRELAKEREEHKGFSNPNLYANNPEEAIEKKVRGFLGEFAFEKMFDLQVNREHQRGADYGVDFVLHGITIDIKTSTERLIFANLDAFKADIAVLVTYDPEDYGLVWVQGYIPYNEFHKGHQKDSNKWGEYLYMEPKQLSAIVGLRMHCQILSNQRRLRRQLQELSQGVAVA